MGGGEEIVGRRGGGAQKNTGREMGEGWEGEEVGGERPIRNREEEVKGEEGSGVTKETEWGGRGGRKRKKGRTKRE